MNIETVARALLGDPNPALSRDNDLRYGTHGSLSINTEKGTFYDHESETGGGILDLIARERSVSRKDAAAWAKQEFGISFSRDSQIVATYDYADEQGELLYQVCRFEPKDFRQRKPNGNGWDWSVKGTRRVLYRLPDLTGEVVYIVEGEKDADRLHEIGLQGTCNAGGAGKWRDDYTRQLIDAGINFVVVLPDNDDAGRKHAEEVAKSCHAAGLKTKIVCLPGLPDKGDVSDWLATHSKDDLIALVKQTPVYDLLTLLSVGEGGDSGKMPLPDLPAVHSFDFALLPDTLQAWARDVAERIQCPPDYVGVTVMAALGSVIGRKVGLRPQGKTDWTEYPNQWALVIGRPGVLKSPAMEQALLPLKRLAAEWADVYQSDIAEHQTAAKVFKLQAEAAEKEARAKLKKNPGADVSALLDVAEPQEPTLKRYIANDTSAASLGELLRQNPNGLLVYRDEIVSLLKGLDREDAADARGFYLTGWNGNSGYTFDRIGRGLNLHIPAVCLSMLGSTQPGRISEYLKHAVNGGAGDDGLIQRFGLLVWPDISGDWRDVDEWPDSTAKRNAHEVFQRLDTMEPQAIGAEYDEYTETHFLRFTDKALTEFREWREGWERKLRSGDLHPALESHLAKYRKLVPALALIIHLADNGQGPVSHAATLKALAWSEYLESHAVRAYSSVTAPEVQAAKAILRRIEKGDLKETFTARDVYNNGWAHLSDSRKVHEALTLLVDYGYFGSHTVETGGRPSTVYGVLP